MFTYSCAACGKHHVLEAPVEQPLQTKCLRCGAAISVAPAAMPPERVRTPSASAVLQESITKILTSKPTSGAAEDGSEVESEAKNGESSPNGKKRRKQPADDEEGEREASRDKKVASARRTFKEAAKREEEAEENKPVERPAWSKPAPVGGKTPPGKKGPRPRWQLIAAVATAVLVIGVTSGFLIFGGKKAPAKQAAKAPAKPKPAPAPPKKKVEPPPQLPPPPAPKTPPKVEFVLSAPRLSEELEANPAEKNAVYAGKILEVSGLFARIEKKDGLRATPRPHAVFATEGPAVSCDLQGSRTDLKTWSALPPNQPFTVRGVYEKDGFLRDCFLMPYTPSADGAFKGKDLEVAGCVREVSPSNEKQTFPAIKLEGDTNSTLGLLCFFRTTDADEVQKIRRGSPLTVHGVCSGRYVEEKRAYVRLDNCRLIYTSAPSAGTPRLEAAGLLRRYEEDFHAFLVPPPGAEEQIQTPLLIKQVAEDLAADPKIFTKKYRNRVITVLGTSPQAPKNQTLILQSADTDQMLKVQCRFGIQAFEGVDKRPEYRVRGLCLTMPDARTLVLDNCELHDPAKKKTGPTLTADYLPHVPGKSLTYDIALFGVRLGKSTDSIVVRREVHHQSAKGLTESLVTHTGPLIGTSLFDEDEQEKWIAAAKTKKIRILMPGPMYYHRLSAGFVEIGDPEHGMDGKETIAWAPALKLGARVGDKWSWDPPSGEHAYVLEQFSEYRGRPSVVIRESITRAVNISYPIEILHVYVKGLGEVERRAWMQINKRGDKRPVLEKKLVEPARAGKERKSPVGAATIRERGIPTP